MRVKHNNSKTFFDAAVLASLMASSGKVDFKTLFVTNATAKKRPTEKSNATGFIIFDSNKASA